jgi:hypothetical protein
VETLTVLSGNSSESMALVFNQTQLATLWGAGISKRSSGAVSTAGLIYTDTTVTAPPTTAEGIVFQMSALTNQQYAYKEPVIVDPGYGLVVWGVNQNLGLGCTFEWYEEPNT